MIDLLLFIFLMGILVLLYFQWKVKGQQERLIETEAESLRELQKRNSQFKESGLFGLPAGNPYLRSGGRSSGLMTHRIKVLGRKKRLVSR
jgi:hypothetical protein